MLLYYLLNSDGSVIIVLTYEVYIAFVVFQQKLLEHSLQVTDFCFKRKVFVVLFKETLQLNKIYM